MSTEWTGRCPTCGKSFSESGIYRLVVGEGDCRTCGALQSASVAIETQREAVWTPPGPSEPMATDPERDEPLGLEE